MNLRQTRTYVILDISQAAYDEIAKKLRDAKYDHAFHQEEGAAEVIDMQGIALRASADEHSVIIDLVESILKEMEASYDKTKFSPVAVDEARRWDKEFPGMIKRVGANQGRHLVALFREKMKGIKKNEKQN